LYIADEIFVCGTAAEVSAVRSVDDRDVPCPGEVTTTIGQLYGRVVRGQESKYLSWCELAK
jgi:branched-chain amino acid aminotransferase